MTRCCEKCFSDKFLIQLIQEIGEFGKCDYCECSEVKCVGLDKIATYFKPVINLYSPIIEFQFIEDLKENPLSPLWEAIESQWNLLSDDVYQKSKEEVFYQDLLKELQLEEKYTEQDVGIELDYYGIPIEESNKLSSMWEKFAEEIKYKNRYFVSSGENKGLLEKIAEFSPCLVIEYKKGFEFYRARINSSRQKPFECGTDMSSPPPEKCTGGRANPTGIPYLYVATDFNTAIGEVEPTLADSVTVANFELIKNIEVIKLSRPISPFIFGNNLYSFYRYYDFLIYLGIQLSIPYSKTTELIEYVPTQYLCEYFRHLGYAGVQYHSLKGAGENLVIFDKNFLKCTNAHGYYINKILYETEMFPINF